MRVPQWFSPAANPQQRQERRVFLRLFCLAAVLMLAVELCNHKAFTDGPASFLQFVRQDPLAVLVNFALVLLTLIPALFLRRRAFWCALLSAVWLIGGAVNGFILLNRMTPFTVADLTVLHTGLDTLPNYVSTKYIVLMAVALLALAVGMILLFLRGPRNELPLRRRMTAGLLGLVLSGGLLSCGWELAFQTGHLSTTFSNLAFAYED